MSFADKTIIETYGFVSLIVKITLLGLASVLSFSAAAKTQYFVHVSFNSTFQLTNGISNNAQKLFRYFNGTVIVAFFRIPLGWFETGRAHVFSNN